MVVPSAETINEVDFCAKMASACTALFRAVDHKFPFVEARVEGMGSSKSKRARKDLRFYGPKGNVLLTGEVKLPGGVGAFDSEEVKNAHDKAEHANVQFFFTWDVNTFVLWDRSQWDKPLLERRVNVWHLRLDLSSPQEVARPETLTHIERRFLPDLLKDVSDIVSGHRRNWALPPDEVFLRSLESHLDWPVSLLRQHIHEHAIPKSEFESRLQAWMISQDRSFTRSEPDSWRKAVDNAARSLAYIWTNRFIFYKALRSRFPELPKLELGPGIKSADQARRRLTDLFRQAASISGDYETLLFPEAEDWGNDLVFTPLGAVDAWRAFLRGIESVDFRDVPADIVGRIFQQLISPAERHRFGQHFTGPDAVDLINAFCIRRADDKILDPACGSGSFLVRAYYRKRAMKRSLAHTAMLGDLFGCDISLYPAHLATLNLAAREINDEANYPRIARNNFFDIDPGQSFCEFPDHTTGTKTLVSLPALNAVTGNPPYVRHEQIDKKEKSRLKGLLDEAFKGTVFSGRADYHCYFWPHAARFLKEDGYFGFLTSAQWLDVDYGFDLQRWILRHFKIISILESATERWFADARVKTCITILQRCTNERRRMNNLVRFVRFERPLAEIIGLPPTGGVGVEAEELEQLRQGAVDRVRDRIERRTANEHNDDWRLLVKRQGDLWEEGVRAGAVVARVPLKEPEDEDGALTDDADSANAPLIQRTVPGSDDYIAGKWGRYLRAPDLYFEILEQHADRLVPLGQIVDIRFGVKTGCDAFFMPKDVSDRVLADNEDAKEFRTLVGVSREEVASGVLRVIEDGDGTLHPLEPDYLRPEMHTLRDFRRVVARSQDMDRVLLTVSGPMAALKGTHVHRYLRYGQETTYKSKKSKAVPVPQRSTCAARDPWYDLRLGSERGFAFWPMAHHYRHVIPANPDGVVCNHRMFDLLGAGLTVDQQITLVGTLNSTWVALSKTFFGRYTGTEGSLDTEVIDVELLEVPDPRAAAPHLMKRIVKAFKSLSKREIGRMVEDALLDCHSYDDALDLATRPVVLPEELTQLDRRELDDAVFELIGVTDALDRARLIDRTYEAVALHFRDIRVTEIQKMEDRRQGSKSKFSVTDLATDAWDALELTDVTPLGEWTKLNSVGVHEEIHIPSERPVHLDSAGMFESDTVYFGKTRRQHLVCTSRGQAELVRRISELGVSGVVSVPRLDQDAMRLLESLNLRHATAMKRLRDLAESRTADDTAQVQVLRLLERWYVIGKPTTAGQAADRVSDAL